MNMSYGSDWTGKAVVVVVAAIMVVIAAAFMLGGAVTEHLQWLNPQIAKAIADFKVQQARNMQLLNDKLQEEVISLRIENDKRQTLAQIEIDYARQWGTLWPRLIESFASAVADVIRVVGLGFTLLVGYLIYRQFGARIPQSAPAQNPVLRFNRAAMPTRTFGFQVDPPNASEISSETNGVNMRLETPAEKERHRFLRELGRRREAERRRVLTTAPYNQGGDAMI